MNTVDLLFYFFATLAVGGGVLMVFSRHPVSAALFMIISLVSVAALFVLLEAFFLAILQVLVYAGAVMVLFLFIIMLLDVGPEGGKVSRLKLITGLAGCRFCRYFDHSFTSVILEPVLVIIPVGLR